VARILGDGRRQRTRTLSDELQSHHLFADRFGGRARATTGQGRRAGRICAGGSFLVPIPQVTSFAELNARLLAGCRRRWSERLRGHDETIGERLTRDRDAFLSLPQAPDDARAKRSARVNSLSLVRYRAMSIRCRLSMGIAKCCVRLRPRGGDCLRSGRDRASSPMPRIPRARGLHLQPTALAGAAGSPHRGRARTAGRLSGSNRRRINAGAPTHMAALRWHRSASM
jgi:hypothetical protein